ncbi:MAG: excinuclease ABC subunit UvrB [Leptospiraceae bacterium]|nr:excinuclease ABC subunit UvrB [Leptospiraceae bacterium]
MAGFKLTAPYEAAGDQPRAIDQLTHAWQKGQRQLCLEGVTGSGKTYTMAAFIERVQRPALVLTHNKTLAAQLYREFREFFPHNAVEYFVSYYDYYQPEAYVPTSDTYIEKDASINDEIDRLRLRATSALLERSDVVVVASVSCIYGLGSPEEYRHSILLLESGIELDRETVMRQLLHIQYDRNDISFSRGVFRVRGDVVDIYPAYREEAIRIEWFGDEIESITLIDPLTGKELDKVERAVVYPAKHFITSPPRLKEAVGAIEVELQQQIRHFNELGKPLEAERVEQRTRYDMEMLREMGYCNGIENYSRHLTGRAAGEPPACLLNYFQDDFLLIVDESHVSLPQVRGMYAGDRARKQTLVDFGFRLPSALDNRPLNFSEFEKIAPHTLYVSATPGDYELEQSQTRVEQINRPTGLLDPSVEVRPVKGQMEDLLAEIRRCSERNERVLITTLTKKMAEDLSDYLSELEVRVAWLHSEIETIERVEIIRDLRRGTYDALIGVNLLREGLDMPEVALVMILDADKQGFLRNARSLIQTMGRAARNENGRVILYADTVSDAMRTAMDETLRRRQLQTEFNAAHGITPRTIHKKIADIIERQKEEFTETAILDEIEAEFGFAADTPKKERMAIVQTAMLKAAQNLEFEKAALLRDKLEAIRQGAKKEASVQRKAVPFRPRSSTNARRSSRKGNPDSR